MKNLDLPFFDENNPSFYFQQLIARGKADIAIEQLIAYLSGGETEVLEDAAFLVAWRWRNLEQAEIRGMISKKNAVDMRVEIISSLLRIVRDLPSSKRLG
ncbi:MAG: hypothetical protein AAFW73_17635 [Bacteroidota bacterium]